MSGVMVDWVTGSIQSPLAASKGWHLFDTGRFQKVSPQGELLEQFAARLTHAGSYDSALSFRAPYGFQLEMSGNPVKFFQGHNLWGVDDHLGLFLAAGLAARGGGAQFPSPMTFSANRFELPKFTRLDLTRSYRFDSNEQARAWLRGVGASGHSRHKNALRTDGTIYYGKNSTRWSMKIYQKFDELQTKKKGHELSWKLKEQDRKNLLDWAVGVVRFEVTLRSPEIEKLPINWDSLGVWQSYYERVQFNQNSEVIDMKEIADVSPRLQTLYAAWRAGTDLRSIYSKNAFYTNRRALLAYGVDIAVPPLAIEQSEVKALLKPENWDPQPIEELTYRPEKEVIGAYGL